MRSFILRFITLLIYILPLISTYSQSITPYAGSVLLEFDTGRNSKKFGTGFYVVDTVDTQDSGVNYVFLVTAKHVLGNIDKNGLVKFHNPIVKITRRSNLKNEAYATRIINLKKLDDSGMVAYHKTKDLAIVLLAIKKGGRVYYTLASESMSFFDYNVGPIPAIPKEDILNVREVALAAPIYVSGYPITIGLRELPQYDYKKPLIRSGIVAGYYNKNHTIILDFAAYGGYSGSPVYINYDNKLKLIGLVTQRIPFLEDKETKDFDNSGFAVALSGEVILTLISKLKKELTKKEMVIIGN